MNDRHLRVLHLVAESHIASAAPVASSHIANQLGVSSATIRSDFQSLEAHGLLQQPHTSAGRVPTSLGYGQYVQYTLPPTPLPAASRRQIRDYLAQFSGEELFRGFARVAAHMSGYAVTITLRPEHPSQPAEVHLARQAGSTVEVSVRYADGSLGSTHATMPEPPAPEVVRMVEEWINELCARYPEALSELASVAHHVANEDGRRLVRRIARVWDKAVPRTRIREGLPQLLDEPEGSLTPFVKMAVQAVENDARPDGVHWRLSDSEPLTLHIAEVLAQLQTSLVHAGQHASISVVGPSRMRYKDALSVLAGLRSALPVEE